MGAIRLPRKFPLLPRKKNSDKSHYGHALIVAGSRDMTGAAVLTATAALRTGSGLVTLGIPLGIASKLSKCPPEIMKLELPGNSSGCLGPNSAKEVLAFILKRNIRVLGIGPGLSTHSDTVKSVVELVAACPAPMVLDADGLNAFRNKTALLKKHSAPLILTPHRKEFERLFGEKCPESEALRIGLAKKLSKFYHVVLVLKGPRTLVVENEKVYVNSTGNPGMAKGGSGDVLTGMIAAFVAQGLEPFESAAWAVHFHGKAADLAVKKTGELGLTASDIINFLPKAFALV